jgi:hypothetical protein
MFTTARRGTFSGPSTTFGQTLSVVHPPDNIIPMYDPEIESEPGLSLSDKQDLQRQVDELMSVLQLARDYVP